MKMNYILFGLFLFILIEGCSHDKKSASTSSASIYKIWQYKAIDTTISRKKPHNFAWIGNNQLNLTNKDTLKFSYGSIHNKPSTFPYKIQHDTIFIQNKPGYKILKLTADELHLLIAFKNTGKDSTVVIYQAKQ